MAAFTSFIHPRLAALLRRPANDGVVGNAKLTRIASKLLIQVGFAVKQGESPQAALEAFQRSRAIPVTGKLDRRTLTALQAIARRAQAGRFDGEGQKSARILCEEKQLAALGYDVGAVDGVFDKKTAQAVVAFKKDQPALRNHYAYLGNAGRKMLATQLRQLRHQPYHVRVKGTAAITRLDATTAEAARRGIREGADPRTVRWVQKHLVAAGFNPGRVDGRYDGRTEAAVKAFQRAACISQTGEIDSQTWASLKKSMVQSTGNFAPPLTFGEKSYSVWRAQRILRQLGYKVKQNGLFDEATLDASRKFEERHPGLGHDGSISLAQFKAMAKVSDSGPITRAGRREMAALARVAQRLAGGRAPQGYCLGSVEDMLQAISYGKIGHGAAPRFTYAHQFADWLNEADRYKAMGLKKLNITNPYLAPPGAIVVVRAGTPGTSHPTAGDITVAMGHGRFLNDGEMGYGGPSNFPKGNGYVLGIYVPA